MTRLGFVQILCSASYALKPLYPQSVYSLINVIILSVASVIANNSDFVSIYIFCSHGRQGDVSCVSPVREFPEIVGH
jgi:hypothetical protein